eukprot:gene3526-3571_t
MGGRRRYLRRTRAAEPRRQVLHPYTQPFNVRGNRMNKTLITLLLIAATVPAVQAQDRIYRCGNEYTNNAQQAKERGCKLVEGGNVTVVQGTRPASAAAPAAGGAAAPSSATSPANAPRVSNNEQKSRDSDARAILESELRKAETRHAELLKEYNNGAPERNALDLRNPQRYTERTAELKASVARSESDIAGIKREIARLPAPAAPTN